MMFRFIQELAWSVILLGGAVLMCVLLLPVVSSMLHALGFALPEVLLRLFGWA